MVVAMEVSMDTGAWCGIASPLLLASFLSIGGRLRKGYDKTRDTMSALGDGVDIAAIGFLLVNIAIGILLGFFAWGLVRPTFGRPWWLVAVAALGSVVIAITPGNERCRIPGRYGRPSRFFHRVHLAIAGVVVGVMALLPVIIFFSGSGPSSRQFRVVNAIAALTLPVVVIAFVVVSALGRRQLRSRLVRRNRQNKHTAERPWEEPALWLDRDGTGERLMWAIGYTWVVAAAIEVLAPAWTAAISASFAVVAVIATFRPQRIAPLIRFSVETCQPNTLYGARDKNFGEFRFLRIIDPEAFRSALDALVDDGFIQGEPQRFVRLNGETNKAPRGAVLTIGFTHSGLTALGVDYRWASTRHDVFADGMAKRCESLGDNRTDWEAGWGDVDVGVWVVADDDELTTARTRLDGLGGTEPAVPPIATRRGGPLSDNSPLKFKDGISQPWVLGVPASRGTDPRGAGKWATWGPWQPIATGEFVLGQVDEANDRFPVPDPAALFLGGTFAAVRKLELKHDRIERLLETMSERSEGVATPSGEPQDPLARLVGRTVDGTPLVRDGAAENNRFRYGDDPYGLECPVTSHIRRANPRDALGFNGLLADRRRMIRRGMPYMNDSDSCTGELAGLMFVALVARLDDQFEFIQRRWLNDGASFGIGKDPDAIAGHWQEPRQVVLPTIDAPMAASLPAPLAVARGGAYLFLPSIRGLHYLARGLPTPVRRPLEGPAHDQR